MTTNKTLLTLLAVSFTISVPAAAHAPKHPTRYSCRAGNVPLVITAPLQQTRTPDFGEVIDLNDPNSPMPITRSVSTSLHGEHGDLLELDYKDAGGNRRRIRIKLSNPESSTLETRDEVGSWNAQALSCRAAPRDARPAYETQAEFDGHRHAAAIEEGGQKSVPTGTSIAANRESGSKSVTVTQ